MTYRRKNKSSCKRGFDKLLLAFVLLFGYTLDFQIPLGNFEPLLLLLAHCGFALSFSAQTMKTQKIQHREGDASHIEGFRLGFITDVEGNLEFFKQFVSRSNVLEFESNPQNDSKTLNLRLKDESCYFVFGGDAVDKGPGDIRLCRALVSLKKKYPERVYLLVGNRDLNKVRFTAELSEEDMKRPIDEIPAPHWDPKAPSLRQYLEGLVDADISHFSSIEKLNTRINRLKYMLKHTLGCPKTFEFRREELSILKDVSLESIDDNQVLESMIHEIQSPDGSLFQYLEHANVAVKIGNNIFCHGAIDNSTIKYVPLFDTKFENPKSKPPPKEICDNLVRWVDGLNDYLRHGLLDYQDRPYWNSERNSRGGESLMALQNRPAMWGRSIVSNCYADGGCITTEQAIKVRNDPGRTNREATDPLAFEKVSSDPMDPEVAGWLLKHGIHRIVVGHKPTGDCPAVLSALYTGVEVVSADTSFSDTKAGDNRGVAVSNVEIVGKSTNDNHLEVSGVLSDGECFSSVFPRLFSGGVDQQSGDPMLGCRLENGWWVKAATPTHYQLCRGAGRNVEYKVVPISVINIDSLQIPQHRNAKFQHGQTPELNVTVVDEGFIESKAKG